MSIEILVTLTYIAAILFMMSLCWGIGVVTAIRRMRLERMEPIAIAYQMTNSQQLLVIGQPFGNWREWNENQRENTGRINSDVVMPMRYQQPQIFADPSIETKTQNPNVNVKAS